MCRQGKYSTERVLAAFRFYADGQRKQVLEKPGSFPLADASPTNGHQERISYFHGPVRGHGSFVARS